MLAHGAGHTLAGRIRCMRAAVCFLQSVSAVCVLPFVLAPLMRMLCSLESCMRALYLHPPAMLFWMLAPSCILPAQRAYFCTCAGTPPPHASRTCPSTPGKNPFATCADTPPASYSLPPTQPVLGPMQGRAGRHPNTYADLRAAPLACTTDAPPPHGAPFPPSMQPHAHVPPGVEDLLGTDH
jgi:hypothetical protein